MSRFSRPSLMLTSGLGSRGNYWGVSVSAYFTTKYGKQFSKSGAHSTIVTVSIAVDANSSYD
jgi:hypothetical protein